MGAALALLDNIPQLLASIVPSDWQSGATTNDSSSLRVLFTSGSVASDVSTRRHSIGTDTSAPNRPVLGGVFDGSSTSGGLSEHFDLESPAWGASHWMAGFSASTGNWAMEGSSNSIDGVGDDEGGCGGGGADGAALQRFGHTLLVIFSVFNTLGRILAGFWPEHSLHVHVRLLLTALSLASAAEGYAQRDTVAWYNCLCLLQLTVQQQATVNSGLLTSQFLRPIDTWRL